MSAATSATSGAAIVAEGLGKNYGAIPALKTASFRVEPGQVFAIIGPNGAGKTTLFKVLTGEVLPDRGTVLFGDLDVSRMPAHERTARGFGRTFQVARVFPNCTARDNLVVAIEARRRTAGQRAGSWLQFRPAAAVLAEADEALAAIGLAARRNVEARFLSHGDKKRLELALTLALKPSVLMLDEPTAGMSPPERQQIVELLTRLRVETGVTMLLTEHDMDVVFGLAHRIMVLNYGEAIAIGTPEEIHANQAVRELYLGEELEQP